MKIIIYLIILILFSSSMLQAQLKVVTNEAPPTGYTYKGKFTGIITDIVKEIEKNLNINIEIRVMPWARSYKIAEDEPNVVIYTAGKTKKRITHGFYFVGPIITRKHVLWSKKDSAFNIKHIRDIKEKNLNIVALRGDWRFLYLKNLGLKVLDVSSHNQGLKMLILGRADLWVSSDIEAPSIAKNSNINMDKLKISYVLKEAPSYIMLSKDTDIQTVEDWKNAYIEIQKTNFPKKNSQKWSKILNLDLKYTNTKGFYVE